jgi:CHRD domain
MRSLLHLCLASIFVSLVAFGQTTPPTTTPPSGKTSLTADLSPANLVPPIDGRTEAGTANVDITMVQATTSSSASAAIAFEITLENATSDQFTGFSINRGAAGLNGAEVMQFPLNTDADTPASDTISGQTTVTAQMQMDGLQQLLANPDGYYVVLTTADNPAGLLRGQLAEGDLGGEMDSLSTKLDNVKAQLNVIQEMIRSVGSVLGIDPKFLPEPGQNPPDNGTDTSTDSGSGSTP